jgi:pSer/pThr/pTyr-binding forkhead associated (FHA) protein
VPAEQLKDAAQTLAGLPAPTDQFAARLQFIADLLTDRPTLPQAALLVWRGPDRSVQHRLIGQELVVGRQAGAGGLTLAEDKLLSRCHFRIRRQGPAFVLHDLDSHNGTAINRTQNQVHEHCLHDGDLILAGNQVFAYFAPPGSDQEAQQPSRGKHPEGAG